MIRVAALLFVFILMSAPAYCGPVITGKVSWYSRNDKTDPFEHKLNADQSAFDENALTCAMRSRAFGKRYKITNIATGRSVIVKHRDYGPAKKYRGRELNRVADLSKAAFARIADLDDGVVTVRIEPVNLSGSFNRAGKALRTVRADPGTILLDDGKNGARVSPAFEGDICRRTK